jgi:hypothetical protein
VRRSFGFALLAVTAGCADLAELSANGSCGNMIVEPGEGEDCDTFAEFEGTECVRPGRPRACRYVCGSGARDESMVCPPGWACASDGVCRVPSGRFAVSGGEPSSLYPPLLVDFDGDGEPDRVARDAIAIAFGTSAGAFGPNLDLPIQGAGFTFADDLDGDQRTDLLLHGGQGGLFVIPGDRERDLAPIANAEQRAIAFCESCELLSVHSTDRGAADALLILSTIIEPPPSGAMSVHLLPVFGAEPLEIARFERGYGLERPDSAEIDLLSEPVDDELAIAPSGASEIVIVSPRCDGSLENPVCAPALRARIEVPAEIVPHGSQRCPLAVFADVDGDGRVDVATQVSSFGDHIGQAVVVAYGDGNGGFCSRPYSAASCEASGGIPNRAEIDPRFDAHEAALCIAGDFNDDQISDFVGDGRLFVSVRGPPPALEPRAPAVAGLVADFNADGIDDLALGPGHFLMGSRSGAVSTVAIRSERTVDTSCGPCSAGDFDGDGVTDFAFAGEEGLWVHFGRPLAAPSPAELVARLPRGVMQLASGHFSLPSLPDGVDSIDDLAVLFAGATRHELILLRGSRGRRMFSTAPLTPAASGSAAQLLGAGRFGPKPDELHDLVFQLPADGAFAMIEASRGFRFATAGVPASGECFARAAQEPHAVFDLEGDGRDELVAFPPFAFLPDESGAGLVAVEEQILVRMTQDGAFECERRPFVSGRMPLDETALGLVDLDADGRRDLVVRATRGEVGPLGTIERIGFAVVRSGSSITEPAPLSFLELDPGEHAGDLAFVQADADPDLEVVILSSARIRIAELRGEGLEVLASSPITASESRSVFLETTLPPGTRLDFDRDGIEDLLFWNAERIYRARQLPVNE